MNLGYNARMTINCNIFNCARKPDTYLYLRAGMRPEELPEALRTLLGDLQQFLTLELSESSKLAQVNAGDVLDALNDQGYFLQLPPAERLRDQAPGAGFIQ